MACRRPPSIRKAGQKQPGDLRVFYTQSLRSAFHQSNGPRLDNALLALRKTRGFCVTGGHSPIASEPTPSPRLWATAPGATPALPVEHITGGDSGHSKPERSTLLESGTFYFALTEVKLPHPHPRSSILCEGNNSLSQLSSSFIVDPG